MYYANTNPKKAEWLYKLDKSNLLLNKEQYQK